MSSCWEGRRSEPIDSAEDVGEQVTRDSDLSHLEDDVATVADGVVARIGCQVLTQAFATTTDMLNAA